MRICGCAIKPNPQLNASPPLLLWMQEHEKLCGFNLLHFGMILGRVHIAEKVKVDSKRPPMLAGMQQLPPLAHWHWQSDGTPFRRPQGADGMYVCGCGGGVGLYVCVCVCVYVCNDLEHYRCACWQIEIQAKCIPTTFLGDDYHVCIYVNYHVCIYVSRN